MINDHIIITNRKCENFKTSYYNIILAQQKCLTIFIFSIDLKIDLTTAIENVDINNILYDINYY